MAVDLRKVKKLIELVEESNIQELEVASGDETVRIVMHHQGGAVVTPVAAPQTVAAPPPAGSNDDASEVAAPMAGTFYRAPHPDAAAFVEVGQQVAAGDVLCIIESMKMMHEIRASQGGMITQICVENGTPVSTGDALFRLS